MTRVPSLHLKPWIALVAGLVVGEIVIACQRRNGTGTSATSESGSVSRTEIALDANAVETVARWLVGQPDERHGSTRVFFLELPNGAEPSTQLLDHVSSPSTRIRPLSACRKAGSGEPTDSESGLTGTILSIGDSSFGPDGRVEVKLRRYCGTRCGESGVVVLEKRGESWFVLGWRNGELWVH
jgi:hypothetical protein